MSKYLYDETEYNYEETKHYKQIKPMKKNTKKANHKHKYKECLLQYYSDIPGEKGIQTTLDSYCTICGKIGNVIIKNDSVKKLLETNSVNELYKEYHDKMPVFFIDEWTGYIDLSRLSKNNNE